MRRSCSLIALICVLIGGASTARAAFPGRDGLLAVQPVAGPGIVIARPGGSITARICTDALLCGRPLRPRFSPDGRAIVFGDAGRPGIGVVAPDGTCLWCLLSRPLTTGPADHPAFGPGHAVDFIRRGAIDRLVLGGTTGMARRGEFTDVAVAASGRLAVVRGGTISLSDGRSLRRLVAGAAPSWSPDGHQVAYAARGAVWIVDTSGHTRRRLGSGSAPAFAPDGRDLAYVTADGRVATVTITGHHRHVTALRGVSVDWQPAIGAIPASCAKANGTVVTSDAQGTIRQAVGTPHGLSPTVGWNGCLNLIGQDQHLLGGSFGGCYGSTALGRAIVAGRFAALQFNFCDHDVGCWTRIDTEDLTHAAVPRAGYTVPTNDDCAASVDQLAADTSGFTAWRATQRALRVPINPPSCPSANLCVAGDIRGNTLTSADPAGGRDAWRIANTENLLTGAQFVSCPSTAFCASTTDTDEVLTSTDPSAGASSWQAVFLPTRSFYTGISCPSASFCTIADADGQVLISTDPSGPAAAWAPVAYGGGYTESVACASPRLCVISDNMGQIFTSTDPTAAHPTWSQGSVTGNVITNLTCPSESFCAATSGGQVLTSDDPGAGAATWTATTLGPVGLHGLSCPTSSFCVATDGTNVLTSSTPAGGASTWTAGPVDPGTALSGIACAPAGLCVLTGSNGEIAASTDPAAGAGSYQFAAVDGAPCLRDPNCVTEQLYAQDDAGPRVVDTATDVGGGDIANVQLTGNATTLTWTHAGQPQSLALR